MHLGTHGPIPPLECGDLMNGCVLGQPANSALRGTKDG